MPRAGWNTNAAASLDITEELINIAGDEITVCAWTHPGNFNPLNLKALV